jgi:hypothetical protein
MRLIVSHADYLSLPGLRGQCLRKFLKIERNHGSRHSEILAGYHSAIIRVLQFRSLGRQPAVLEITLSILDRQRRPALSQV